MLNEFLIRCNLHCLVKLIGVRFSGIGLNVVKHNARRLNSSSLRLESFSLRSVFVLRSVGRKGLAHVSVSLVLAIDQVVSRRDVVVSVRFETAHRVLTLKTIVVNQPLQQVFGVRHGLQTWKEARLMRFSRKFLVRLPHVWVISDLRNSYASFGVRV